MLLLEKNATYVLKINLKIIKFYIFYVKKNKNICSTIMYLLYYKKFNYLFSYKKGIILLIYNVNKFLYI
jgi:hypothetical protein